MLSPPADPIAPPFPLAALLKEVAILQNNRESLVLTRGHFSLLLFQKRDAPSLFHELCRQREITFRLAGQGTGKSYDETTEDDYYLQLVLWDHKHQKLAGAYRLGQTGNALSQPEERDQKPLYLTHMFTFDDSFLTRDEVALELTRSFVTAHYQNDRLALPLLWQGLGQVALRLQATRLFGSVTLSSDFSEESQSLMVSWLMEHRSYQPHPLAKAKKQFPAQHKLGSNPERNIDELKIKIKNKNGAPQAIPPLLRHYLKLGGTFHAFHIESSFNDAVYCLLEVDLAQIPPAHRNRFLNPNQSLD